MEAGPVSGAVIGRFAAASGQSGLQPAGLAQCQKPGRAHRAAHRRSGRRALPAHLRGPAGAGPCVAGPCLGRGRQHRRAERPLLPERMRRDLHCAVQKAGSAGPCVPLLLFPRPAARGQRAPHFGRQRHLSRHLPGPDLRRDRRKAQKESSGLPPDGAG